MKNALLSLLIGLFMLPIVSVAQEIKPSKEGLSGIRSGKRTKWLPKGQNLEFFLKDDPAKYRATIASSADSMLYLTFSDGITSPISFTEFDRLRLDEPLSGGMNILKSGSYVLPIAGVLFFLMDTFNYTLQGEPVKVTQTGVTVGASLISAGLIFNLISKPKTYKLDRNATWLYVSDPAIQLRPKSL